MVGEVGAAIGLTQSVNSKMHVCIHEDNSGALVLAQKLPPQFTPASKHYAVKTHWFRERCIEEEVNGLVIWLLDKAPFERKSQCVCSTECLINPPSNDFSVIGIVNLLRRQK